MYDANFDSWGKPFKCVKEVGIFDGPMLMLGGGGGWMPIFKNIGSILYKLSKIIMS